MATSLRWRTEPIVPYGGRDKFCRNFSTTTAVVPAPGLSQLLAKLHFPARLVLIPLTPFDHLGQVVSPSSLQIAHAVPLTRR